MRARGSPARAGLFLFAALALAYAAPGRGEGDPKRGEYLAKAAGCKGCHTEAKEGATLFAGGRELKTPFGTFYGPNITPHPQAGIGQWREADFLRALRLGERPDGQHYFPAFPYPSFAKITDADARDLWAYFRSLPASDRANRAHELRFPFNWRLLVGAWKALYFEPGPMPAEALRTPQLRRGAYLVNALGHCGECHTPRNWLGGPDRRRAFGGVKLAEGGGAPNLTPARLEKWNDAELKDFLAFGLTPDGDVAGETMGEVIRNTTGQLTPEDLAAVIAYLRGLPPIADGPRR